MNGRKPGVSLGFTRETYQAGTHMCLIYDDDRERRKIIGKFITSGLLGREKVAYFADQATPPDIADWLGSMDIELAPEEAGNLSITEAESTYCPTGEFVPENMLDTLRSYHRRCAAEQYPASRVSGEMSWALRGIPGSERLMEYESLVNEVLTTHPVTAVCQYDARRFDGSTIMECLEVHPFMIVRGQVVHNPYYLKPEIFLSKSGRRQNT